MVSAQTDLLRKIDFFEPLDAKIINKISQVCIEREYAKGDYIVRQGESGLGLFFITSGKVKVEVGREGVRAVVATLLAEDFFGELSIIDNKPRSADVICLEDTRCLLLTRDSFSKLMNKYPEIAIQMAKALAGRIRAANELMSSGSVPSREAAAAPPGAAGGSVPPPPEPAAAGGSAPGAAPSPAPAEENNGAGAAKNKVRDFLVDTFDYLYTVKAITRFSAAVIGCPVTIRASAASGLCAQDQVAGVKIALLPAKAASAVDIEAYGEGEYDITVLEPAIESASRTAFRGRVLPGDRFRLALHESGGPRLKLPPDSVNVPRRV